MTKKIGYLGPKGTFTKLAVDWAFPNAETHGFNTIPECIDAVNNGTVDAGVVPLENAIEGTVHLTIDYLVHQVRLPIVAELVVPIEQHLLLNKDFKGELGDIEEVLSHSHAIAQCHQFIHKELPQAKIEFANSTGRAAEIVASSDRSQAAIGNVLAAKEYGLKIARENIHDYPNNHTRFAVLTKAEEPMRPDHESQSEKTTLLVTLPTDNPGALHQVLSAFSWRKMNLSKIESRPTKTGLGDYFFIIDVNQPYDDALFPGVQSELEALGCDITLLGTYSVFNMK
ncbi:prephenate dehydratase [Aciduricibacillus chroicocephali]|uniref:Prephenate dehydratase n=1 Tax=Aciduricibacillus chroicocephali TaxID=3054939 RepID=A0ABY9KSZ0_9BACI|nr:prephenate dehydratase [Bacillaceae bacterium 44XB]